MAARATRLGRRAGQLLGGERCGGSSATYLAAYFLVVQEGYLG